MFMTFTLLVISVFWLELYTNEEMLTPKFGMSVRSAPTGSQRKAAGRMPETTLG